MKRKRMGRICYLISQIGAVDPLFIRLINRQVKDVSKLNVIVCNDELVTAGTCFSKLVNLYSASMKATALSKKAFSAMINVIRPDVFIVSGDDSKTHSFIKNAHINAMSILTSDKCGKESGVFYITSDIPGSSKFIIECLEKDKKLDFYPKHYVQKKSIASQMKATEIIKALLDRKNRVETEFEKEWGYKLPTTPQTYNETINRLKVSPQYSKYKKYADKFRVRKYIKQLGYDSYLIKSLGIVRFSLTKKQWNRLPTRFIVKPTNASGFNIVIDKKESYDLKTINLLLSYIKSVHYGLRKNEPVYSFWNRFLLTEFIDNITDYKFFCFEGRIEFVAVVCEWEKENDSNEPYQMIVDKEFSELPFSFGYERGTKVFDKPDYFDEMLLVAETISKKFKHIRVDMMGTNDKFYFNELTFFPGGGRDRFNPPDYDLKYGELLKRQN